MMKPLLLLTSLILIAQTASALTGANCVGTGDDLSVKADATKVVVTLGGLKIPTMTVSQIQFADEQKLGGDMQITANSPDYSEGVLTLIARRNASDGSTKASYTHQGLFKFNDGLYAVVCNVK